MSRQAAARLAAATAVLALAGAAASGGTASSKALRLVPVTKVNAPVYLTATSSEPGRLYVVEQAGRIVVVEHGVVRPRPFLDIRPLVTSGGEQGLLSMAFDPHYAQNHLFYVDYTDRDGDTRVVRYRSNGVAANLTSRKQLLYVKDFATNHNGGQLQFGPDGLLYWGNGDGGGGGDPMGNGQSLARPFAKIERLDVAHSGTSWKLVAFGLRNPWRFSFDRKTGDLYIGDVGQNAWEELDYLPHGFSGLANFGWNHFEGTHVFQASTPLLQTGSYVPPVAEYSHAEGCSVTGGYVFRGPGIPAEAGRYFYGDYCSGTVWSLRIAGGKATAERREPFEVDGLSSFGEDVAGNLYLLSVTSGDVYRLAG